MNFHRTANHIGGWMSKFFMLFSPFHFSSSPFYLKLLKLKDMTREEEILKAYNEQKTKLGNQEHTFMRGAKWADAHPDIDVRTMAAWQSGYKEAIEKACEWLRTNLCEHYADEPIAHKMGRPISGYISFFEEPPVAVIGDFCKAMKGGEE